MTEDEQASHDIWARGYVRALDDSIADVTEHATWVRSHATDDLDRARLAGVEDVLILLRLRRGEVSTEVNT